MKSCSPPCRSQEDRNPPTLEQRRRAGEESASANQDASRKDPLSRTRNDGKKTWKSWSLPRRAGTFFSTLACVALLLNPLVREKKVAAQRANNAANRAFADQRADGALPEVDDKTLMGEDSPSFAAALQAKAAADQRRQAKYQSKQAAKWQEGDGRRLELQKKEEDTMSMFKKMAAERFG